MYITLTLISARNIQCKISFCTQTLEFVKPVDDFAEVEIIIEQCIPVDGIKETQLFHKSN